MLKSVIAGSYSVKGAVSIEWDATKKSAMPTTFPQRNALPRYFEIYSHLDIVSVFPLGIDTHVKNGLLSP